MLVIYIDRFHGRIQGIATGYAGDRVSLSLSNLSLQKSGEDVIEYVLDVNAYLHKIFSSLFEDRKVSITRVQRPAADVPCVLLPPGRRRV